MKKMLAILGLALCAMTALTAEAAKPIRILVESPLIVRASISRPSWSVPKGWSKQGAMYFWVRSEVTAVSAQRKPPMMIRKSNAVQREKTAMVFFR